PDHLSKIFEPFFTTKGAGQGTGLGLWVSYGIIKSFRGDIRVSSTPGEGTSFTVLLPLNAKEYQNV
ncbi:MAG: sensor histidine kinase, partial [Bacteroidetes bacterium]|nr:sensor histidine kinase [Bacteroidota bacterium]